MLATTQPMSLSTGQAWQAPNLHAQSANASTLSFQMPDLSEGLDSKADLQRNFTGDACFTIDLCSDNVKASYWLEKLSIVKALKLEGNSKKMTAAVAITSEGNRLLKDSSADVSINTNGIVVGKEAVSLFQESSPTTDLLYPISLLSHDVFGVINKKNSSLSLEGGSVILKNSSTNEDKALLSPGRALGWIVDNVIDKLQKSFTADTEEPSNEEKAPKKNSKKKAKTVKSQQLTLVVPGFTSIAHRQALIAEISHAGILVRGVLGAGLTVVAGSLNSNPSPILKHLLTSSNDTSHVLYIHVTVDRIEVSLIACEGTARAKATGNRLGFQRLASVSSLGMFLTGSETSTDVTAKLKKLLQGIDLSVVEAVIWEGVDGIVISSLGEVGVSAPRFEAGETDAVCGGCLLTAAELDSSKAYLQSEDGAWFVSYILPVGDEVLTADIGIRIDSFEKESRRSGEEGVEVVFTAGTRVSKTESGPLLTGKTNRLKEYRKEFKWGGVYYRSSNAYKAGYPVVTVLERSGETWKPIKVLRPLLAGDGSDIHDTVFENVVTIGINPASLTICVGDKKGDNISTIRRNNWFYLQIVLFIFAIVALIGGAYLAQYLMKRAEEQSHEKWLREFYTKYAPEKLAEDSEVIIRTLRRYEGRLFVLWRKLEKAYGVKFRAPDSIKEL